MIFGKLVQGHNILKKIEDVGDEEGLPSVTVKIINCGEHNEGEIPLPFMENPKFYPQYELCYMDN